MSQSQTYNILKRLEAQGYITSSEIEQPKLPSRLELKLTAAGKQRFTTWLDTPTRCSVHAIRVEFITRLYFLQKYFPDRVQEAIRVQMDEVNGGIESLKAMRLSMADDQTINRLALELRLKLLSSVMIWLEECRESLTPMPPQGDYH